MTQRVITIIAFSTLVIALGLSIVLTQKLEVLKPGLPAGYEDEDLTLEGSRLKGFVFGAEGLVADWYWMNALQYFGGKVQKVGINNLDLNDMTALNPRLLYPYLNNSTDLDPRFMAPYSFGATILPAVDRSHAVALTEKGIANNPEAWRLHQYLGYIFWKDGDYERAAAVYREGSEVDGSPLFMRMMAARMKSEGGSRDTAREMYRQLYAEAQDETSRRNAELRLLQLDSLDERDILDPALAEFLKRNGRCASRWSEIYPLVRSKKLPTGASLRVDASGDFVDPSGAPYIIDKDCRTSLDAERSVIPSV